LPDAARTTLGLPTNDDRVEEERLALRLAVGAARRRLVLSYPRLDVEQSRPRVPSFYGLEVLRAAEGALPGFDELARRAEAVGAARIGWPAPARPEDAIDEAEHDLALLRPLFGEREVAAGTARYLLDANPHLGRALRFRARRWIRRWTPADGLVEPIDEAKAALAAHRLDARSYSPTALQNFSSCPYKFLLYAVHKLSPREEPEAIEEMNPLEKGSLVHEVLFRLLESLRDAELLPVSRANLTEVRARLDAVLAEVAGEYEEKLAPAIARVWEDGIASIQADLREWLRRAADDESGWVPWRFELSFGLRERRARDPASRDEPVPLDCGIRLRGSIDLVEKHAATGVLRVTDYKTGKARAEKGTVVGGGETLQPVLYALVLEKVFEGSPVDSGRLYYLTAKGGYEERTVPLDARARETAQVVADTIGGALRDGFLPAAPAERACEWCDYRPLCGPREEQRVRRKSPAALEPLRKLRALE
jgi:ATP-dependent helicase/nuclease subunit B